MTWLELHLYILVYKDQMRPPEMEEIVSKSNKYSTNYKAISEAMHLGFSVTT